MNDVKRQFVPTPLPADLRRVEQCPGCGSGRLQPFGGTQYCGSDLLYERCRDCNLLFMNPSPSQEWYNRLYKEEFWESKRKKKKFGDNRYQLYKEATWAEKIGDLLASQGFGACKNPEILEIGCAFGLIVKLVADRFGGSAWGVEPSVEAGQIAENVVGTPIYASNMAELIDRNEGERFDLVIFSHCLENITNAPDALRAVYTLLKPGGFLFVDTPNNYFRRSWHIHHPYCFTRPSLSRMLQKSGFETIEARTWGRPKMSLGNLFLSVVARRSNTVSKPEPVPPMSALRMHVGTAVHSILVRGPVGRINRRLGQRRWALDESVKRRVDEISQQIPVS